MSNETKYNGWNNYETWCVALWLRNDEGSYRYWQDVTQECWDDAEADKTSTRKENAAIALADRLKDEIEEGSPLADEASLYSDFLRSAISEIDWHEIAENWLEEFEDDANDATETE